MTAVCPETKNGPAVLDRTAPHGSLAAFSVPARPDRSAALQRRDTAGLLAEDIRRPDPDVAYGSALKAPRPQYDSS
ncbi:OpcA/G6PD domain-containing protein [Streptomyces sp. NPDC002537]